MPPQILYSKHVAIWKNIFADVSGNSQNLKTTLKCEIKLSAGDSQPKDYKQITIRGEFSPKQYKCLELTITTGNKI